MTAVLETRKLVKSFGANHVLKGIDLEFHAGEVTALLGANGAGKSTFLSCISGAEVPSSGEILIDGVSHGATSPREAIEAGIGMIYQHFQLIGALTIADNVFLGSELRTALGTTDRRAQERETLAQLQSLGLRLNPSATVESLSVGQQQIVEIIRSLRKNPRVLILDEPTAALSRSEVDALLELVSSLAAERNIAVIYVSHILTEVMEVADRVITLRDGIVYEDRRRGDFTMQDLVSFISPDKRAAELRDRTDTGRPVVLRMNGFAGSVSGPLSIQVREGEIIGVFGLLGSGRTNLLETIAGIRPRYGGRLELDDVLLEPKSPGKAASQGIVLVPADRKSQALFPEMTAVDNVVLPHMKKLGRFVRSKRAETKTFEQVADALDVHPNTPTLTGGSFSGGNAQKLMIGRWTNPASNARLLLLDEPTQGVDVGAREDIYAFVREYVDGPGRCAIFSTSEHEEAVALADRIIVLYEGEVAGIVGPDITEPALMSLAFGQLDEYDAA
ncbi:sugar ABC transporter ATP-binding protein [Leucobacter ruminantium]|uniref:Sugar ABC transporter ATP-binding protein n=1 Tax=Leucobacter ruminantium TaxID=1289170 RepID=A0A939LRX8_9MICO|nr:sugar ABC transporter ATP-binding protein [Leucobacter ruminantium]MBO1803800.1 sugar ABC transporter ATP-binding protein [Leucobacter ruminantium]